MVFFIIAPNEVSVEPALAGTVPVQHARPTHMATVLSSLALTNAQSQWTVTNHLTLEDVRQDADDPDTARTELDKLHAEHEADDT